MRTAPKNLSSFRVNPRCPLPVTIIRKLLAFLLVAAGFATVIPPALAANTFIYNFTNTTVPATFGPVNPANGSVSISGSSLTAGDVVVFDGIVSDVPGSTGDDWGAVELNYGAGYLGLINSTLGVLLESGTASGLPCQLFLNGSSSSTTFGVSQGYQTNRVRIQLTCTQSGSTANMIYVVRVDQGFTGTFGTTLSGTGVTFANNTITLSFGANNTAHQFVPTAIAITNPTNVTVAAGVPATFAASVIQNYPTKTAQQWLSNGVPVLNATNFTYTTPPTTSANNGAQYAIVVTNLYDSGNVVTSAPAILTVRSTPGLVPFIFNATAIANTSQVNPLNPPVAISGSSLLAGDTVFFDGIVATNGPLTGSGDGWAAVNLAQGGFEGVTAAQLGLLVRLGAGTGQLFINGGGPLSPNPTSTGAVTNRVRIELYPSTTGSTTNMGWLVKVDQNLTGTFLPAVSGTNLTFAGNTIPLSFAAYSVAGLIQPYPVYLQALHQQLAATNLVIGSFDQIAVTADYLNISNVVLAPATPGLVYSSSDNGVVTVSSTGYLQAVGAGQATITSKYSGVSVRNAVTVVNGGTLLSVSLGVNSSMPLYSNQQATVLGNFANATNVNLFHYGQTTFLLNNTNAIQISPAGLLTAGALGAPLISAINSGVTSPPVQVTVTFPASRFIFDTFGDGFWTIANQGNGQALVAGTGGTTQAPVTNSAFSQQYEVLYNYQNSTFRLRNRATWQCLGALPGNTPGIGVALVNYTGLPAQQWYLVDAGGGSFRVVNAQSYLVLQTDNGNPANVTLANPGASPAQNWNFTYQAHYPKKGCAGYDTRYADFGLNWLYNYDDHPAITLPPSVNYAPMIYAAQYYEPLSDAQARVAGWLADAQPNYLLAYNEPDNTAANGGSNTSTNSVIAQWPQIQALNVPIVSPATANTFGSWMYSFYSMIAAHNYRVDYTAVHEYVPPNAASLISVLQSAYTTWGRPVWLTEFSPVDWNNTQSWSENDDYNFLAEFMWQAEDQDWLKRYAIFPFSGTNSAAPWVNNGYRGNFFLADGVTLSPYGELYATWDADRSLDARTPYLIHNLATSFRLTATNNLITPLASTIYVRNATTEWGLLPAPMANHWYVISLNDGRRLRDSSGTLALGPYLSAGSAFEWEFAGPDGSGYYFITNTAGHCLNSSGTAPNISFNLTTAGTQNDNTRWRLVKAYHPVSTLATVPADVSLSFTSQGIALNWGADGNINYNIYRGTSNGGPYTLINRVAPPGFLDTTASSNNVPDYYVITGLNVFGDESAYSAQAAATVAAVWRQQWFGTTANTGNAADTANPANDGILNILKRAFNLNPLVAATNDVPYGTVNGNTFTMTYRKSLAATDLIFHVQSSSDLVKWSTNGINDSVVSSDGVIEIHAASVPVANTAQFMRLQLITTQ